MQKRIIIVGVTFFLAVSLLKAKENVVFYEDFNKAKTGDPVSVLGWKVKAKKDQSLWEIEDGMLKITHFYKKYKGGGISHKVPFISKGMLEFDVKIGAANNLWLSLSINIYGIRTAFSGTNGHLRWTRRKGKNWGKISGLNFDQQYHCRIIFDTDTNTVEYYVDDMDAPVFRDTQVKFKASRGGERISLGSYGLCKRVVINYVDNIKLISLDSNGD